MAKIQLETGQILEFDGTPTPEDVDFAVKQLGIKKSVLPQRPETLPGMPRYGEIEKRIEERPSPVQTLQKELSTPFSSELPTYKGKYLPAALGLPVMAGKAGLKIATTLGKELEVPTSRLFSGIANPVMEFQNRALTGQLNKETLPAMAKESWKGITGQRRGKYEDIFSRIGVPDPVASIIGLQNEIGTLMGITAGLNKTKKLFSSARKAQRFLNTKPSTQMTNFQGAQKAKAVDESLKDLKGVWKQTYDDFFKASGDAPIPQEMVDSVWKRLPNEMKNIMKKNSDVEWAGRGANKVLNPTLKNYHILKDTVDDIFTSQDWQYMKRPTETKKIVMKLYSDIRGNLNQLAESGDVNFQRYAELSKKYSSYKEMQGYLRRMFYDTQGNISGNKVTNFFKRMAQGNAETNEVNALEDLAKQYPNTAQAMRDTYKWAGKILRSEALKGTLKKAAIGATITAPIFGAGYWAINKIARALENGGGDNK